MKLLLSPCLRQFFMFFVPITLMTATPLPIQHEFTISSGLSFNRFLDRRFDENGNEKKVFQRYKSCAPFTQWRLFSRLANGVHSDFKFSTSYDVEPFATNTFNNGAETNSAHASTLELKIALLHRPDPRKEFFIGGGIGAGDFQLHTDTLPPLNYATDYIHCYLPFVRAQNTYKLGGCKAQWEMELSRIDVIYFQGIGYEATHHLWFYESPHQDQGFFLSFSYWDLHIPLLIIQPHVNDSVTSFKVGWEVNFH